VLDLVAGRRPEDEHEDEDEHENEDEDELFNRFFKDVIKAIWTYGV
jgi:hypothetical protein